MKDDLRKWEREGRVTDTGDGILVDDFLTSSRRGQMPKEQKAQLIELHTRIKAKIVM